MVLQGPSRSLLDDGPCSDRDEGGGRNVVVSRWVRLAVVLSAGLVVSCAPADDRQQERADLLGFADRSDPEAVFAQFHRENLRIQERIVACMAEQGFDYVPVEPAVDPRAGGSLTAEEYKERYGWGMMSSWEVSLLGEPGDVDPNEALREGMDEATLLAWEEALYGPVDARADPERREGCQREAEYRVQAYQQTATWEQLEPLLQELPDRIMSDPRTLEADRDWAACMAEHGYRVAEQDDVFDLINDQIFDTWEEQTPPPGERGVEHRMRLEPWFVETDAWQKLIEFELDLAAADTACGQDLDLVSEYQQRFLDEHEPLLEQLEHELAELQQ